MLFDCINLLYNNCMSLLLQSLKSHLIYLTVQLQLYESFATVLKIPFDLSECTSTAQTLSNMLTRKCLPN